VTIPEELSGRVLRLFHVEKWKVGTIARELRIHHSSVSRILKREGVARAVAARPSQLDPYLPFIRETLDKHPDLPASTLHRMVRERGYAGKRSYFRERIATLRPRPKAEAFLRLATLPGDEAQVDWAYFGKVKIGKAERQLWAFVMVLSYSRAIFLRFFLGQHTSNFLRGHVFAFEFFGGVVRVALYDNLKSAVLERRGDAIRFNPEILSFAAHYLFDPRPVAVARGNEKGRVERAIGYVRTAFFAGRAWKDLDDLNAQALSWCTTDALDRPWPQDRSITVRSAFEEEKTKLLPLPGSPYPTDERLEVSVQKTPYARFDLNDYSVPHTLVRKNLVVWASLDSVRIMDGADVVAEHRRSFDKGKVIEDQLHVRALEEEKVAARKGRGLDRLRRAAPSAAGLLSQMAERGQNLGNAVSALLRLLDAYGQSELEAAIKEALVRGAPHPHSVRHVLEKNRKEAGLKPPLPLDLPDDPRVRELTVRMHDLKNYDALRRSTNDGHEDDQRQDGGTSP
jgi:transposase